MKIYPTIQFNGRGNLKRIYCAEQVVGEGLLKYVKRVWARTHLEAITKMLQDIYV